MKVVGPDEIRALLPDVDLVAEIEAGFVAYSEGRAVVPPVGELLLEDPPGDVHIKYGYIEGDDCYVIKIASGFHRNPEQGLPSSNGMMLLFSSRTGEPLALLQDEGYLTDVRTAVAGAICAKYLAPADVRCIGIVGTGMQARLQLEYLQPVTACRKVLVLGRDADRSARCAKDMSAQGFDAQVADDAAAILEHCNLVVTTTAATEPVLTDAERLRPGTHITAMGSDTPAKQELDAGFLAGADLVVADSIAQCEERGEIHHALRAGAIRREDLIELGNVISGVATGRTDDTQVTIADLTGVAVQDIAISKAVYSRSAG